MRLHVGNCRTIDKRNFYLALRERFDAKDHFNSVSSCYAPDFSLYGYMSATIKKQRVSDFHATANVLPVAHWSAADVKVPESLQPAPPVSGSPSLSFGETCGAFHFARHSRIMELVARLLNDGEQSKRF